HAVLLHARGVSVVGGQRVPVGNKEEAVVLVLHADPVLQRAHVVAEVQLARRAHAAQHAFLSLRLRNHESLKGSVKAISTGLIRLKRRPPPKNTSSISPK